MKGRSGGIDVELWDCSGDHKYEPHVLHIFITYVTQFVIVGELLIILIKINLWLMRYFEIYIGLNNIFNYYQYFCVMILFMAILKVSCFLCSRLFYFTYFYRFESCWAAMAKDTNGIVFVYNPDQPNQDKDLESW